MELIECLDHVNIRRLAFMMQIPPTTIYEWRNKRRIPTWRVHELKKALKTMKSMYSIPVSIDDFKVE